MPLDDDVSPSIADAEGPNLEDVAEVGEVNLVALKRGVLPLAHQGSVMRDWQSSNL